mmetsp:Transcript_5703/g.10882  ORF Transcript_5703/g.10882 Transcript_5703/m.10882 type:complete len:205 (+) Transcript_5703:1041-1655(+)
MTFLALSSGFTCAITFSIPTLLAMACAVLELSPVTMNTSMPCSCSLCTVSSASGLAVSATATMPHRRECGANEAKSTVFPADSKSQILLSSSDCKVTPCSASSSLVPIRVWQLSTVHDTPFPTKASNSAGCVRCWPPSVLAYSTTARPSGCSEPISALPTRNQKACSVSPGCKMWWSVTQGLPYVSVPVLSKIMAFTLCAISRG